MILYGFDIKRFYQSPVVNQRKLPLPHMTHRIPDILFHFVVERGRRSELNHLNWFQTDMDVGVIYFGDFLKNHFSKSHYDVKISLLGIVTLSNIYVSMNSL